MTDLGPLEKDIERIVCDHAKKLGWLCYKFTSPAKRSVPDRMFLHQGKTMFIEFKRKGQKPTPAQEVEIAKIRKQGIYVGVIDRVDEGKKLVERMLSDDGMF